MNENFEKEQALIKEELQHLREKVDGILQRIETSSATPAPETTKAATPEPAPAPEPVPTPEPAPTPTAPAVTASDLAALAEKIDTAAYQEGVIRDLHEELQRYKKGFLADIAKSYVMDIIRIYEVLADTNAHFNPDAPDFDVQRVKHLVSNNLLSISDLLEDQYSIECFTPKVGDAYLPKEHKAMRTIETDDESLVSTVAECLGSGFKYIDDGRLLRQARVVVYKKVSAS